MKLVIQRVQKAFVEVDSKKVSDISKGLLVFFATKKGDTAKNLDKVVQKLINLRIFSDENDKMNLSVKDVNGSILVVSQFTLYADLKSRRPSFMQAQEPKKAEIIYNEFIDKLKKEIKISTGIFGAKMEVFLINDGPVTIILEV